jgi:hypothetical protein
VEVDDRQNVHAALADGEVDTARKTSGQSAANISLNGRKLMWIF